MSKTVHASIAVGSVHPAGLEAMPSLRLTLRDINLLVDLFLFGSLLRDQIHALHFKGAALRRCNRRLKLLVDAGLIEGFPMPLGPLACPALFTADPDAPGSGQKVYRLRNRDASVLVATHLGWEVADVRRRIRAGTPTALTHALSIAQVRIVLEQATPAVRFLPELLIQHRYEIRARDGAENRWRMEFFKPDAYANVDNQHYFIEVDMGNVGAEEWGHKITIAARYHALGLFTNRYNADTFHVLVLTTGERRRAALAKIAQQEAASETAAVSFLFATFTDFAGCRARLSPLDAPIWHAPGQADAGSVEEIVSRKKNSQ